MFAHPILVIDTETSGFAHRRDKLLEVGAVLLDTQGVEVDHFTSLINPGVLPPQADRALRVNGLTRQQLAQAPPLAEVRQRWLNWCYDAASKRGLRFRTTSYNVSFDRAWTEKVSGFPPLIWRDCIMHEVRARFGSLKLAAAVQRLQVQAAPTHRGLDDARAAAGVLVALEKMNMTV
jgi:DNA polymerase-3 subunit epsilon